MKSLSIIFICIISAIGYGIIHDQITIRISIEYFTIGHPRIFPTDDPTLIAIGWGVISTWWLGLLLGVILVVAARVGSRAKRTVKSLIFPIGCLLLTTAIIAIGSGLLGWHLAKYHIITLTEYVAERVPKDRHISYLVVIWIHLASYITSIIGGLFISARIFMSRVVDPEDVVIQDKRW